MGTKWNGFLHRIKVRRDGKKKFVRGKAIAPSGNRHNLCGDKRLAVSFPLLIAYDEGFLTPHLGIGKKAHHYSHWGRCRTSRGKSKKLLEDNRHPHRDLKSGTIQMTISPSLPAADTDLPYTLEYNDT